MDTRKKRVFGSAPGSNPIIVDSSSSEILHQENLFPSTIIPETPENEQETTSFSHESEQYSSTLDDLNFSEQTIHVCPVCNNFSGNISQINSHLDSHFNPKKNVLNAQESVPVDDLKDAVFGFLRNAGQKVRGIGNTITSGKLDSELSRLGFLDVDNNSGLTLSNEYPVSEDSLDFRDVEQASGAQFDNNTNSKCSYEDCTNVEELNNHLSTCQTCNKRYCSAHIQNTSKVNNGESIRPHNKHSKKEECVDCSKVDFGGPNSKFGPSRSHFEIYSLKRDKNVKNSILEANRIQSRLDKLRSLYLKTSKKSKYYGFLESGNDGIVKFDPLNKSLKVLEKDIVPWESDKTSKECSNCQ
ncbi:hypothetical protein AYI68_g660 [Smittium mucronatum]|uniref:Uncharacterized protein n=1 Tax=Smittium mucronatum TaxID=133383 RepID=A0A1R0H7K2_9FUNG|nr:hypothetical protein AYI68_g660 [Smittium mucronatum]